MTQFDHIFEHKYWLIFCHFTGFSPTLPLASTWSRPAKWHTWSRSCSFPTGKCNCSKLASKKKGNMAKTTTISNNVQRGQTRAMASMSMGPWDASRQLLLLLAMFSLMSTHIVRGGRKAVLAVLAYLAAKKQTHWENISLWYNYIFEVKYLVTLRLKFNYNHNHNKAKRMWLKFSSASSEKNCVFIRIAGGGVTEQTDTNFAHSVLLFSIWQSWPKCYKLGHKHNNWMGRRWRTEQMYISDGCDYSGRCRSCCWAVVPGHGTHPRPTPPRWPIDNSRNKGKLDAPKATCICSWAQVSALRLRQPLVAVTGCRKRKRRKKFIKLKKGYQVQKVTGRASTQKTNEPRKGIKTKHNKRNEVSAKIIASMAKDFMLLPREFRKLNYFFVHQKFVVCYVERKIM